MVPAHAARSDTLKRHMVCRSAQSCCLPTPPSSWRAAAWPALSCTCYTERLLPSRYTRQQTGIARSAIHMLVKDQPLHSTAPPWAHGSTVAELE